MERRLNLEGIAVAAKVWGDKSGLPVLAIHGWLDNAAGFDALIPQLGAGLQVVAIDLPGHGRSEWRQSSEVYHFIDWVAVVLQAADALGWDSFSILGHSMGAAIASLTAPVAVARVKRMVFLDGIGPWSNADDQVVEQLRRGLKEEKILGAKDRRKYGSIDDMVKALGIARVDVSEEKLKLVAQRASQRCEDGELYFCHDMKLRAGSRIRLTEAQVMAFLRAIECPVFLVRPRSGWPVDEKIIEGRLEAIEDLKVMKVKGGHHVHLEAPERLADEVGRFLRD